MRRGLHRFDERFAATLTFEASKLLCGDDDDFVPAVDGHTLRTFAADAPDKFAEAGFGVLELPFAHVSLAQSLAGRLGRAW